MLAKNKLKMERRALDCLQAANGSKKVVVH
jgi:hypothetical protein